MATAPRYAGRVFGAAARRERCRREENLRAVVERTILTYEGMQVAPSDGLRRELLGGDLYVSPAPSPTHQLVVGEVFVALRAYAMRVGGKAFVSPIDVVFSQTDAVQPDVVYVGPERLPIIGPKYIAGTPTLIVEVLSPSSSDVDPRAQTRNVCAPCGARVLDRRPSGAGDLRSRRARRRPLRSRRSERRWRDRGRHVTGSDLRVRYG
jgi:hypothetical protein